MSSPSDRKPGPREAVVPEERRPGSGTRDSWSGPEGGGATEGAGVRAAPLNEPPPASRNGSSDADNTQFLSDEFGIPESKAASAVAGPGASEAEVADLAADVHQRRSEEDPLAGIPTLESSDDFTADADETRLKPVIGRTNNRTGAG